MSKKMWGGRFSQKTHPLVEAFTASILFDCELAEEDLLGSLAHAEMLKYCGLLTPDEHLHIKQGLEQLAKELSQKKIAFSIEDEDIHMNIERLLSEKIGPVAGKLHTARSRNDQVALDLHLYLRKKTLQTIALLVHLQKTLLNLAKENADIILPGYTHLQRAQPISLAKHWLAYFAMLERDISRLKDSWKRLNQSPLGACALAGTTLNTDKHYTAQLLGFDTVYENSLDAVSDRDFIIEFIAAGSLIMMHISRLSEELILWSSQEFNFISFEDAFCTGSSMMPQKKNPDVAELGRGKTGRVYGALFNVLTMMKALPLSYNKDMQEDKEPLFDTVKTLENTLSVYIILLENLKINKEVMLKASEEGFLNATLLAEYLVSKGVPFREAHGIVGKMVAQCIKQNCKLEDLPVPTLKLFSPVLDEELHAVLTIKAASDQATFNCVQQEKELMENQTWLLNKEQHLSEVDARFF